MTQTLKKIDRKKGLKLHKYATQVTAYCSVGLHLFFSSTSYGRTLAKTMARAKATYTLAFTRCIFIIKVLMWNALSKLYVHSSTIKTNTLANTIDCTQIKAYNEPKKEI